MKKTSIFGATNQRKINKNWFTAKTWIKIIPSEIKTKEQDMYNVHFENGSRTKLHLHDGNQVLIAQVGKGSLEIFKKIGRSKDNFKIKRIQKITLNKGDVVSIPANTLHTHGSIDKKREFSHVAINILPKKNGVFDTVWYESDFKTMAYDKIKN